MVSEIMVEMQKMSDQRDIAQAERDQLQAKLLFTHKEMMKLLVFIEDYLAVIEYWDADHITDDDLDSLREDMRDRIRETCRTNGLEVWA